MKSVATVSINFVSAIVEMLNLQGEDAPALLEQVGIPQALLSDPFAQIAAKQFLTFVQGAIDLTQDEALGFHIAQRVDPGVFSPVGYASMSSKTFEDALVLGMQYQDIITYGVALELIREADRVSVKLVSTIPGNPLSRFVVELGLAGMVKLGRTLTDFNIPYQQVSFRYPPPPYCQEYEAFFQCPLEFNAPFNQLVFAPEVLALPILHADPILSNMMKKICETMLASIPKDQSLTAQVRHYTVQLFEMQFPGFEDVAAKLGMSPRTLRRKLKEEETSFQEILDDVRCKLSMAYLKKPTLSINEIALLMGFSEPSTFHRAFKKWTGQTPGAYRRGI